MDWKQEIENEIIEVCRGMNRDYDSLDPALLYRRCVENMSFIIHDRIVKNWAQHIQKGSDWIRSLRSAHSDFEDLNVNVISKTCAIAWGLIRIKTEDQSGKKSEDECYQTWVFSKNEKGEWELHHGHVSGSYNACYEP